MNFHSRSFLSPEMLRKQREKVALENEWGPEIGLQLKICPFQPLGSLNINAFNYYYDYNSFINWNINEFCH